MTGASRRPTLELGALKLSSLNVIPRRLNRGFLEALFEVGDTSCELRARTLERGLERLGLRQTLLELLALGGVPSIQLSFLLSGGVKGTRPATRARRAGAAPRDVHQPPCSASLRTAHGLTGHQPSS
jgi:hypothetical protein